MMLSNIEISKKLVDIAQAYPEDERGSKEVVFRDGSLKIKCEPNRTAILKVAAKYKRNKKCGTSQSKSWGVWGVKLNEKTIDTRYADDADINQFKLLL